MRIPQTVVVAMDFFGANQGVVVYFWVVPSEIKIINFCNRLLFDN